MLRVSEVAFVYKQRQQGNEQLNQAQKGKKHKQSNISKSTGSINNNNN